MTSMRVLLHPIFDHTIFIKIYTPHKSYDLNYKGNGSKYDISI